MTQKSQIGYLLLAALIALLTMNVYDFLLDRDSLSF